MNLTFDRPTPVNPTKRASLVVTLAAMSVMAVAACGTSTRPAATPASESNNSSAAASIPAPTLTPSTAAVTRSEAADACRLITPAEAETAVGASVGAARPLTPKAGGRGCQYMASFGSNVTIIFYPSGTRYSDVKNGGLGGTDPQPFPGVGDEGFLSFTPGVASALAVFRVGTTVISTLLVTDASIPSDALPARLHTIASTAAKRL